MTFLYHTFQLRFRDLLVFAGLIFSFLPSFIGHKTSSESGTSLASTLRSEPFHDALLASVSVSIPLIIEHFFDNTMTSRPGNFHRSVRVLGLIVPNLVLLIYSGSDSQISTFLPSILGIQSILYVYSILAYLNELAPYIWKDFETNFLITTYMTCIICSTFRSKHEPRLTQLNITIYMLFAIATTVLLWKSLLWIRFILRMILQHDNKITREHFSCTIQMFTILIFACIGKFALSMIHHFRVWEDMTTDHLEQWVYLDISLLLLFTIFNDRLSRKELLIAQNALEIKRNFVNYISHEMRTPLNTVFLGLKLLQDDFILNGDSEDRLEIVNDIKTSCDISLSILNELLTFDKLESGKLKLEIAPIQVWDFIKTSVKPFEVQAQQAGIELEFADEESTAQNMTGVTLEGDEHKLGQVVRNFVSNALKFTPRGGKVVIRVSKYSIKFSDSDSGSRIPVGQGAGRRASITSVIPSLTLPGMVDVSAVANAAGIGGGQPIETASRRPSLDVSLLPTLLSLSSSTGLQRSQHPLTEGSGSNGGIPNPNNLNPQMNTSGSGHGIGNQQPLQTTTKERRPSLDNALSSLDDDQRVPPVRRTSVGSASSYLTGIGMITNFVEDQRGGGGGGTQSSSSPTFGDEMLKIEVIDTGAGISAENQKKVFREVIQFNPGRLQKGGGSGLGLYITRGIVELHHGTVSVFSAGEGCGSTFTVELPLSRRSSPTAAAAPPIKDLKKASGGSPQLPSPLAGSKPLIETIEEKECEKPIPSTPSPTTPTRIRRISSSQVIRKYSKTVPTTSISGYTSQSQTSSETQNGQNHTHIERSESKRIMPLRDMRKGVNSNDSSSTFGFTTSASSRARGALHRIYTDNLGSISPSKSIMTSSRGFMNSSRRNSVHGLRVLVVDDSLMNRKMLCRHLKKKCELIYEADNGLEALDVLKKSALAGTHMDIVLMDHQMPEMDGPTAAKGMRALGFKGMIVGVTGNALPQDKQLYLASGADHILTKPIDVTALEAIIDKERSVLTGIQESPSTSSNLRPHRFTSQLIRMLSNPTETDNEVVGGSRRGSGNDDIGVLEISPNSGTSIPPLETIPARSRTQDQSENYPTISQGLHNVGYSGRNMLGFGSLGHLLSSSTSTHNSRKQENSSNASPTSFQAPSQIQQPAEQS